ncbi:hypothetical protein GCM10027262_61480 [Nocardia tengchongensis]
MVQNHDQDVPTPFAGLEQRDSDRWTCSDVETGRSQLTDAMRDVGAIDLLRYQADTVPGCQNNLPPFPFCVRIDGPQGFVPIDHIHQSQAQRSDIESAGQLHHQRNVVCRGGRVGLIDQPHPILRRRQRNRLDARFRAQHERSVVVFDVDMRGEFGDGRLAEQIADRHSGSGQLGDSRGGIGRGERIAAQFEEVVQHAYSLEVQHLGEDGRDRLLDRRTRRHIGRGRIEDRLRQRPIVHLAVHRQRQLGHHHDNGGHHVLRQQCRDIRAQSVGRTGISTGRHNIGHEPGRRRARAMDDDNRRRDRAMGRQRGANFIQLDAKPTQLHLLIGTATVFQLTLVIPACDIAAAIEPLAWSAERAGNKSGGSQR